MQFSLFSRPGVGVLLVSLLGAVSPTYAGWMSPTSMSPMASEDDSTVDPVVSTTGSGTTTSNSGGTLIVSGTNTYSGGSSISAGSVAISASNFSLEANLTTISGSLLNLGTFTLTSYGTFLTGSTAGAVTLARGTTLTLDGSALTLINGGTYTPGTSTLSINGATLALNGTVQTLTDGSQLTLAQGQTLTVNNGAITLNGSSQTTSPVFANVLGLSGSLDDLSFKLNADTGNLHVTGTVTLHNSSAVSLKNVTATVYLSADNLLSADDIKLLTLSLSDLVDKGKIGKGKTLTLPLKHKLPSVYGAYLEGKYLIVVLNADNLDFLASTPIVIGPLSVP